MRDRVPSPASSPAGCGRLDRLAIRAVTPRLAEQLGNPVVENLTTRELPWATPARRASGNDNSRCGDQMLQKGGPMLAAVRWRLHSSLRCDFGRSGNRHAPAQHRSRSMKVHANTKIGHSGRGARSIFASSWRQLGGNVNAGVTAIRACRMRKGQLQAAQHISSEPRGRQASSRRPCCHKESAVASRQLNLSGWVGVHREQHRA